MTAAISEAAGRGVNAVICASTGNTAASAAAYAARAGMRSIVLIPQGKVAAGKLAGAVAYGAQVLQVLGSFDDALALVVQISQNHPIALVNSLNPYRLEGKRRPPLKSVTSSARRPTCCACRSVTPAISAPIGWDSNNTTISRIRACQCCWECRPPEPRRWCWAIRWRNPRHWQRPSASDDRHAASRPCRRRRVGRAHHRCQRRRNPGHAAPIGCRGGVGRAGLGGRVSRIGGRNLGGPINR